MALEQEELRRRVSAARQLRGLTQKELNRVCKPLGLGSTEAGRVERGTLDFQAKHRLVFTEALQVPERWFTEPDVNKIVGYTPPRVPEHESAPGGDPPPANVTIEVPAAVGKISPGDLRGIFERVLAEVDQAAGRAPSEASTTPDDEDREPEHREGDAA